jgi:predicted RNA-binding protein associated with RNAse of E/G family
LTNHIIVHKLNERGEEVWRYSGRVVERSPSGVTLTALFDRETIDVEGLVLERGDCFLETFYNDRWYNVFAIDDHRGRFKGWYCNVARPARIEEGHVYAEDLALDLVVLPDGTSRVLDEDEFARLPISEDDRKQAIQALSLLEGMVSRRSGPFERLKSQTSRRQPRGP